jgi:leucyl aminopeptidase
MGKKTKRGGNSWKSGYKDYKAGNKQYKNKIKRLERYIKNNPKDEQAKKALERIKAATADKTYTRNKHNGGTPFNQVNLEKLQRRLEMLKRETKAEKAKIPEYKRLLANLFKELRPKVSTKKERVAKAIKK